MGVLCTFETRWVALRHVRSLARLHSCSWPYACRSMYMYALVCIYVCVCVEPAAGLGLAIANLSSDYHLKITFCVMRTRQKCSNTLYADAVADLYTRHEQVAHTHTYTYKYICIYTLVAACRSVNVDWPPQRFSKTCKVEFYQWCDGSQIAHCHCPLNKPIDIYNIYIYISVLYMVNSSMTSDSRFAQCLDTGLP